MLKTVVFGFMLKGYISVRELEDSFRVNVRYMYLMDWEKPSYRKFGYFINEVLAEGIEELFVEINEMIFQKEHFDLNHLYIDGTPLRKIGKGAVRKRLPRFFTALCFWATAAVSYGSGGVDFTLRSHWSYDGFGRCGI